MSPRSNNNISSFLPVWRAKFALFGDLSDSQGSHQRTRTNGKFGDFKRERTKKAASPDFFAGISVCANMRLAVTSHGNAERSSPSFWG